MAVLAERKCCYYGRSCRFDRSFFWLMLLAGLAGWVIAALLGFEGGRTIFVSFATGAFGGRLRDLGISSRWVVPAVLLLAVAAIFATPVIGSIADVGFNVACLITLLIVGLIPSRPGTNCWGPPARSNTRRYPN